MLLFHISTSACYSIIIIIAASIQPAVFCCCATLVSVLVSEGDDPKSPLCTSALAALVAIEGRLGALSDRNSCMGSLHASVARGISNIEYNFMRIGMHAHLCGRTQSYMYILQLCIAFVLVMHGLWEDVYIRPKHLL